MMEKYMKRLKKRTSNIQIKEKEKHYLINLKKKGKGYDISKPRVVKAKNYKEASKKLKVSPYAMRTYGSIITPRRALHIKKFGI